MMGFEISAWSIALAVFLRLYVTIVAWSFPIAAVLLAKNRSDGSRGRRTGLVIWAIVAGLPWVAQPVFWIIGIAQHGWGWLLGVRG